MLKYLLVLIVSVVINLLIFVAAYYIIIYSRAWWTSEMAMVALIPFSFLLIFTLLKGLKFGLLTLVTTLLIFLALSFGAKLIYFAQGCPVDQQLKSEIPISINYQVYKIDELIMDCKPWKGPEPTISAYPEGFFGFIGGPTLDPKVTLVGIFYASAIAVALALFGSIRNILIRAHKWQNPK